METFPPFASKYGWRVQNISYKRMSSACRLAVIWKEQLQIYIHRGGERAGIKWRKCRPAATPSYVLKPENEKSSTSTMTMMAKTNMDTLPILSKSGTSWVSSVWQNGQGSGIPSQGYNELTYPVPTHRYTRKTPQQTKKCRTEKTP